MVFSSIVFLFIFLPVFLLGYFLLNAPLKNVFLLFSSLLFYYWGEPAFLPIMIASILWNYLSGILVHSTVQHNVARGKNFLKYLTLFISIAGNIVLLFYFKYYDFVITSINQVFSLTLPLKNINLPIGISFFTFQGLSYVIDVYRGHVTPQKNPLTVGLYISMFPQLIAGPIVRYVDIENEIKQRSITIENFYAGISRFITGLAKKVLIANSLALPVDQIFAITPAQIGQSSAWLGAIFYTLQIYFDFSGYSDMAIGLGKMIGFHFLENFNYPYVAKSMTEFWRRWHISLSTWFRDYVYIPLGGNRYGNVYLHLIITFFLTGLWHGASWNFVIWGLWHGAFLIAERLLRNKSTLVRESMVQNILCHIYTMTIVVIGWIFFRAPTLDYAIAYLKIMFGLSSCDQTLFGSTYFLTPFTASMLVFGVICSIKLSTVIIQHVSAPKYASVVKGILEPIALLVLMIICEIFVMASTYNPFIYFRF